MTAGPKLWTEEVIYQRRRAGHGSGEGPEYIPWLLAQEVSNSNTQTRVYAELAGRTLHLASELDRHLFLALEAGTDLLDFRETFPLPRELTVPLAKELRLSHPRYPKTRVHRVLTVSAMVKRRCRNGEVREEAWDTVSQRRLARKVIPTDLKIRRACCEALGIEHHVFNEESISRATIRNLESIRGARRRVGEIDTAPGLFDALPQRMIEEIAAAKRRTSISAFCQSFDRRCSLPAGTAIRVFKLLLGRHELLLDLEVPDLLNQPLSSIGSQPTPMYERTETHDPALSQ